MANKTFTVTWDSVVGAENYAVTWNLNGIREARTFPIITTHSIVMDVQNGDIIDVVVQACNSAGCSLGTSAYITAMVESIPADPVLTLIQE